MYRLATGNWYLERVILLMAGTLTVIGLILALTFSLYWLILNALVGLNLLVFALTGFCPSAILMSKMGLKARICHVES
jgi:hypothetical protein